MYMYIQPHRMGHVQNIILNMDTEPEANINI